MKANINVFFKQWDLSEGIHLTTERNISTVRHGVSTIQSRVQSSLETLRQEEPSPLLKDVLSDADTFTKVFSAAFEKNQVALSSANWSEKLWIMERFSAVLETMMNALPADAPLKLKLWAETAALHLHYLEQRNHASNHTRLDSLQASFG